MTSVAAACCAHILRDERVQLEQGARPQVPAVLVSASTQALICGVFGKADLFAGLPEIERRVVAWGPGASAVELPHSAVLVPEEELVRRFGSQAREQARGAEWTIFTSRPLPRGTEEQHFGTRRAWIAPVTCAGKACFVESLENGWLFLIPGWLIAVGEPPEALLGQSRLVAEEMEGAPGRAVEFAAYPRIADPLCGEGWLACGSAAMAFDPICGDGTGNAVREAILASAVVRAADRGEPEEGLRAHYRARLTAGFRRHLELALEFYKRGHGGAWWRGEGAGLERGLAWCAARLAGEKGFRYRLEGFDLIGARENDSDARANGF